MSQALLSLQYCSEKSILAKQINDSKKCRWVSQCTPVSSINKADRHDIAEILLKVALNTTTLTLLLF
jgi:hypothetical protein